MCLCAFHWIKPAKQKFIHFVYLVCIYLLRKNPMWIFPSIGWLIDWFEQIYSHFQSIRHFFLSPLIKTKNDCIRYNDSVHVNRFICIRLLHVLQSHCEWHRLVGSNVVEWHGPFSMAFLYKFFSMSSWKKELFSSTSLMSLFHLVAACARVFVVVVYVSKLWINIQKLYGCISIGSHSFPSEQKRGRKMIKSKSHFSNMILTFPSPKHQNLNHAWFRTIQCSSPGETFTHTHTHKAEINMVARKKNIVIARKFCNSLFCV